MHLMTPNNFAMKDWHIEHAEKVLVRFARGLSPSASAFEKRNFKKYGTLAYCTKQIQYDMKHGVELNEIMELFRGIRLNAEYADLRSNDEAAARLQEIEDQLSGAQKIREDRFLWHRNSYKSI